MFRHIKTEKEVKHTMMSWSLSSFSFFLRVCRSLAADDGGCSEAPEEADGVLQDTGERRAALNLKPLVKILNLNESVRVLHAL